MRQLRTLPVRAPRIVDVKTMNRNMNDRAKGGVSLYPQYDER